MVSGGNKCIKYFIFVFNFLFFLTGCGLVGLGVWLNVDQDDWEGISDFNYISVANVAIAAGAIIVIVAFLGCCGAITENKYMLLGFFTLLVLIFIMELGAGIAAYIKRGDIEDELKDQLEKRIPDRYYSESGIEKAMDKIQKHFDCCGVASINDWNKNVNGNHFVPASCCRDDANGCTKRTWVAYLLNQSQYNKGGCYKSIEEFLEDNLLYVGITGIIFAIFQLIGMTLAMILFCAIHKESQVA